MLSSLFMQNDYYVPNPRREDDDDFVLSYRNCIGTQIEFITENGYEGSCTVTAKSSYEGIANSGTPFTHSHPYLLEAD